MKKPKFGYLLLLLTLTLITYASFNRKGMNAPGDVWLLASGFTSSIILWFWMIVNFLLNRKNINHPILWGAFLLFGSWLGAAIYFIIKYNQPDGKCSYSRFRGWIYRDNKYNQFYGKVAMVSFVLAIFHHDLMETLYLAVGIHNSPIYQFVTGVIYFPFRIFMKTLYLVLSIDPSQSTEKLILFARIMRFIYTYILFCVAISGLLIFDKRRLEKNSEVA